MREINTDKLGSGATRASWQRATRRQVGGFLCRKFGPEGQSALAAKRNEPELKEADLSVMASRTYSVFWLPQSYVQRLGNMRGESALSLRAGHSTNGLLWASPHQ